MTPFSSRQTLEKFVAASRMAEARAAVGNIRVFGSLHLEAIIHRAKLRGPQAHVCEGGLVVVFPSPSHLWRLALYKSYHTYNHFQRACWPAPVWAVMLILTLCVSHVIISTGESWFRSGPVATWSVSGREHTFVSLARTFCCKGLFFNSSTPLFAYVHQYLATPQALERRRAIPWSARSVCIPPNLPHMPDSKTTPSDGLDPKRTFPNMRTLHNIRKDWLKKLARKMAKMHFCYG